MKIKMERSRLIIITNKKIGTMESNYFTQIKIYVVNWYYTWKIGRFKNNGSIDLTK